MFTQTLVFFNQIKGNGYKKKNCLIILNICQRVTVKNIVLSIF